MNVAERLSGLTRAQLRELDFLPVNSQEDLQNNLVNRGVIPRDPRLAAGHYVTREDIEKRRAQILRNTPDCLKR